MAPVVAVLAVVLLGAAVVAGVADGTGVVGIVSNVLVGARSVVSAVVAPVHDAVWPPPVAVPLPPVGPGPAAPPTPDLAR